MNESFRSQIRKAGRLFYTGGTFILVLGLLLATVQQSANANPDGPVAQTEIAEYFAEPTEAPSDAPASERPEATAPAVVEPTGGTPEVEGTQAPEEPEGTAPAVIEPTLGTPVVEDTQVPEETPADLPIDETETVEATGTPEPTFEPTKQLTPILLAPVAIGIAPMVIPAGAWADFDDDDYHFCQFEPGNVTVSGTYFIPGNTGKTYILETAYRIVHPSDLATDNVYWHTNVSEGTGTFTVTGYWPGIRAGDTLVETHYGVNLIDPSDGTHLTIGGGLDLFYIGGCDPTPTNTPETPTVTPTETLTPTFTSTPETPTLTPTETSTPTETPTETATVTATFTSTPSRTIVVNTATPTSTATRVITTLTSTPFGTVTATSTPSRTVVVNTATPTDPATPTATATPVGGVLIPVTGADFGNLQGFAGLMIASGLILLAIGFLLAGLNAMASERKS